jgi:membrane protease YdiL (CAAX protease family)
VSSPKPWKLETCGRLLLGVVLCGVLGAAVLGLTRYDPIGAKASLQVCRGLGAGCIACLLAALALVLGRWTEESLLRRAGFVAVLVFVGLNLAVLAQHFCGVRGVSKPTLLQIVVSMIFFQGASLLLVARFLRQEHETWATAFGLRHDAFMAMAKGLGLALVALPACWLLQAASVQVLRFAHYNAKEQSLVEILRLVERWPARIFLGLTAVLLAPVAEEVLFRGILYPTLKQFGSSRLAWWGSSLLFAAIHLNAASFIPLLLLALLCAWLYERTQNLLAPIVTHLCFNAANLVLLFVIQYFQGLAP